MPWINLTVRRGTFTKDVEHAVMAKLTDALMFWEKIPGTPEARKKMKGWVYEVAEDSDYNGGTPHHKDPFYFIEVRLPAGRSLRMQTRQALLLGLSFNLYRLRHRYLFLRMSTEPNGLITHGPRYLNLRCLRPRASAYFR